MRCDYTDNCYAWPRERHEHDISLSLTASKK